MHISVTPENISHNFTILNGLYIDSLVFLLKSKKSSLINNKIYLCSFSAISLLIFTIMQTNSLGKVLPALSFSVQV